MIEPKICPMSENKKRIAFVDAIKAFTIFCVVYWHLSIYTGTTDSLLNRLYMPFFLTLFFFISGYFSYNKSNITLKKCIQKIFKRCKSILIPSIIVCTMYALYSNMTATQILYSEMKGGYWFTFTIFQIYVFYNLIELFLKWKSIYKLTFYFLLIFVFSFIAAIGHNLMNSEIYQLFSIYQAIKYIPFFYLGIICNMKQNLFFKLITNDYLLGVAIVMMGLLYLTNSRVSFGIQGYIGIFLTYGFFYKFNFFFEYSNIFIKLILKVGQNTLPIYFIHYFLLNGISVLSTPFQFILNNGGWIINGILTSIVAIVIIFTCIVLKKIISISPTLNLILLGHK